MSGARAKRPASYEDLLAVSDDLVAEVIDDELIASPRPSARHAAAASALGEELGPPFKRGVGAFFDLAPDCVCEVLSPKTAALDRTQKRSHYGRAGVGHLWLVDPDPRTLEVYRADGDGWRLAFSAAGDVKVRAEPFDAIDLDLSNVWAR